jgi:hypothetical protein
VEIQALSEEVSALKTQIGQKLKDRAGEQLSTDFSELQKEPRSLKVENNLSQCSGLHTPQRRFLGQGVQVQPRGRSASAAPGTIVDR